MALRLPPRGSAVLRRRFSASSALPRGARWSPVLVAVAGAVATAVALSLSGIRSPDAVQLVTEAVLAAAMASGVAWLLLVALRRSSLAAQLAIATLAPVVAVAISVWWAASGMFILEKDASVLAVVLIVSASVGLVAALLLGRRVAAATRDLEVMARRIGDPGAPGLPVPGGEGPVRGPGELAGLAAELETTAQRLEDARAQSEALEASRRELVAWVSHDLRTPLAGIRAMAEALEDGIIGDAATVARYHRTVRQETERLAGLVDELFELSRIQSGVLELRPEPVRLGELLTEATAGAAIAASLKGVALVGPCSPDSPVVALSTSEMSRVVRNLLDNAIRHTPPGGTVDVGVASVGDGASLWVDDGCGGIPAEVAARVFEPAYRGDRARTPGDGSAGLGLAVAKGLVEAHGAAITVDNVGGGCRFTVTFPPSCLRSAADHPVDC